MKFKKGDQVYTARLGKGVVKETRDNMILVQHERGGTVFYDKDGKAPHGQLHFFAKKE